jgi:hypothetical protein
MIFRFAEGREKARHSASMFSANTASSVWSGIFVSTSEYSFNDYAARSGETRALGELARCLDVPALTKGRATIFDRAPKSVPKKRRRRWARKSLIELRTACSQNRGLAIKAYIRWLLASDNVDAGIAKDMERFRKECNVSSLDGALQHAAKYFGLIYAGGRMAIRAKILPWDADELRSAIVSCFRDAVQEVKGYESVQSAVRKCLRKKLRGFKFEENTTPGKTTASAKACWEKQEDGTQRFFVESKTFRDWFRNDQQRIAVVNWLEQRGRLHPRNQRSPSAKRSASSLEWAVVDMKWKDGRKGTFVFDDPFS